MSEHSITDELNPEDRAALTALDRIAAGDLDAVPGAGADQAREYLEVFGALAYGLEPSVPAPEVKDRILAAVSSDAGRSNGEARLATPSNVVPMMPARPASAPPRFPPWTLALAAMLALCLLGLGYLSGKLSEQSRTIARLSGEIQPPQGPELAALRDQVSTITRRFHMVTSIARQAYHMQGVELVGSQTRPPDGVVYVCGYHQRWYLNLQGLEPPPPGKQYTLWFLTEGGMVNGGVVDVRPDASSEMEAQSMPAGTHGFAVSLEEAGRSEEPEGTMVLLGEEAVSL